MLTRRVFAIVPAVLLALVGVGCGQLPDTSGPSSAASSSPTSDADICSAAIPNLSGYQIKSVTSASGGQAAAVEAWLKDRPASAGLPGGPDRGLSDVSSTAHVTVCVYTGVFPFPHPPAPDGKDTGPGDGGRFIILPSGKAVLDTEGSAAFLKGDTPPTFSSAASSAAPSSPAR
jgi:hypothetical protein